jgi:hypothetical protein
LWSCVGVIEEKSFPFLTLPHEPTFHQHERKFLTKEKFHK